MLNIVIPMAGEGSRFRVAGYSQPKPFIDVAGQTMIARVISNLSIPNARFILVTRKEHAKAYFEHFEDLKKAFQLEIIEVDGQTEGTACTVLHARKLIANSDPLLIANSDQFVAASINEFYRDCLSRRLQGSIICFRDSTKNPKWSFARINSSGLVQEVAEKKPISELATVGIYLFSEGKIFVDGAVDMIARNERVNNEFYTCPVYNHVIGNGYKVGVYEIDESAMNGLGTPEDLELFLKRKDVKGLLSEYSYSSDF